MAIIANRRGISRRAALAGGAALFAGPALAESCRVGLGEREKGPVVWGEMDQVELDAAYDQSVYAPLQKMVTDRYVTASDTARAHLGDPRREAYGPSDDERLDIFRTKAEDAPIYVFIHGGAWRGGQSRNYAFAAENFVNAGAHYVVPDFINIDDAGGDLGRMADQVRRAIAWVHANAESFGGDPGRIYVGGHSSGGHLCGVAAITDWPAFDVPTEAIRGWHCMSGMFDLEPVRLSYRGEYIHFTDEMEDAMSAQRHLDMIHAPVMVAYGTDETPEFQRQSRDFAAAMKAAGKPVELVEAPNHGHFEMCESLGNPYGPNGRAARELMGLSA